MYRYLADYLLLLLPLKQGKPGENAIVSVTAMPLKLSYSTAKGFKLCVKSFMEKLRFEGRKQEASHRSWNAVPSTSKSKRAELSEEAEGLQWSKGPVTEGHRQESSWTRDLKGGPRKALKEEPRSFCWIQDGEPAKGRG